VLYKKINEEVGDVLVLGSAYRVTGTRLARNCDGFYVYYWDRRKQ